MTRVVIDEIVSNGDILVFCPDDDPDHIIGWIAHGFLENTPLLHFIFVKKDFRQEGIGTELIRAAFVDVDTIFSSYWSFHMQQMNARQKWGVKFISNLLPAYLYTIMNKKNAA